MAGKIKKMLDQIVEVRSQGDRTLVLSTRTKLILKGLNPDTFSATSPDDPVVMVKVRKAAFDLGVTL